MRSWNEFDAKSGLHWKGDADLNLDILVGNQLNIVLLENFGQDGLLLQVSHVLSEASSWSTLESCELEGILGQLRIFDKSFRLEFIAIFTPYFFRPAHSIGKVENKGSSCHVMTCWEDIIFTTRVRIPG